MKWLKHIARVLITLAVVALAVLLAWTYWREYLLYPWTRDGQVQAYVVGMAARVSGPMVNVPVVDNQPVQRGDLLFAIDPTDYEQDVASAQASLDKAKTSAALLKLEIERRTQLVEEKLISLEDYQILEAQYAEALADIEVARADLDLALLNLSYTEVLAPVDGYITNLVVTTGTYVTKGQPLMAIVDAEQFWVTGYFRETDLKHVEPGKRAIVRLMGHYSEPMAGVVQSVGWGIFREDGAEGQNLLPVVEPTVDWVRLAQRFPVRVHLLEPREDLALRVGTTASVIILPDDVPWPDDVAGQDGIVWKEKRSLVSADDLEQQGKALYPLDFKDGRGDPVTIEREPERIVSLAPSTTELVYALGAGDKLIANTRYCLFPEAAQAVPKVAGFDAPNVENLLALEPDLVLVSDITRTATVERLRRVGLTVLVLPSYGLSGLKEDMATLGRALNREGVAARVLHVFDTAVRHVRARVEDIPEAERPRVFLAYGDLETYTAGPGTFPDELIAEAGGRNVAHGMGDPWAQLSMEAIVEQDPEVILVTGAPEGAIEPAGDGLLARYREHPVWSKLTAVREGRVYVIDNTLFNIPGPRLTAALMALEETLHPAAQP